ncbi:MerR family transcriptional regulator [Tsukamurella strandjordii]|uniref:helix-turn-helix domain-containing protein n=1 Tax=Tsukamurella TaxID=2060 RepID=UPI001C7D3EBA|nr:MerR family transcriptional regulator [Tsukamurella sp. TY48]
MTIGEASRALGVETHVLRHWDEVGALRPSARTATGHRRYSNADLDHGRLTLRAQHAGMSLADIAQLNTPHRGTRAEIVTRNLQQLQSQREQIDAAITFLRHTLQCTHPILNECPQCVAFVGRHS